MEQQGLFYESAEDALIKSIAASGRTQKEIACLLYPGKQPETAKSLFSRATSLENTDVHLNVEHMLEVMRSTRPDDILNYLCDEFGYERPHRKNPEDFKREIKTQLKDAFTLLKNLSTSVEKLGEI